MYEMIYKFMVLRGRGKSKSSKKLSHLHLKLSANGLIFYKCKALHRVAESLAFINII